MDISTDRINAFYMFLPNQEEPTNCRDSSKCSALLHKKKYDKMHFSKESKSQFFFLLLLKTSQTNLI